jgi:hypothetical protein
MPLAHAKPAADEPFVFEPVPTAAKLPADSSRKDGSYFHVLDLSWRGDFVAFARSPASVAVWSVRTGRKTVSLTLSPSADTIGRVALAGDPCVVVAGFAEFDMAPGAAPSIKETPLTLASCATGQVLATIAPRALPRGELLDLTPVAACSLVVAQYEYGIAVVDVKTRQLRPDLADLIAGAVPVDRSKPWATQARWGFKAAALDSANGACTLFGVSLEWKVRAKTIVPSRVFAFDLQAKRSRLLKSLTYEKSVIGLEPKHVYPEADVAISPSGRNVAIHFSRDGGASPPFQDRASGIADMLLIDLASKSPETVIDISTLPALRAHAFLSESEMLWLTGSLDDFRTMAFDTRSRMTRQLCSAGFGDVARTAGSIPGRQSPTAISVNTKLNLVAAVINGDISVLRYKRNPAGSYSRNPAGCN